MTPTCKVYTCPLLPELDLVEPESESKDDKKNSVKKDSAPIKIVPRAFSFFAIPSVGSIGGLAGAKSGAFDVLSDVSGALVRVRIVLVAGRIPTPFKSLRTDVGHILHFNRTQAAKMV